MCVCGAGGAAHAVTSVGVLASSWARGRRCSPTGLAVGASTASATGASTSPAIGCQTKAALPVIARPTMRVFISRVPSYE